MSKVKIVIFAPIEYADAIRRALGDAGAGQIGEYSFCSYSTVGKGRFTPSLNANPHIGEANYPEQSKKNGLKSFAIAQMPKQLSLLRSKLTHMKKLLLIFIHYSMRLIYERFNTSWYWRQRAEPVRQNTYENSG